mgnify:FL=1
MGRRHHVHTKVMCWMTVDRACRVARHFSGRTRRDWEALRGWIAEEVVTRGWSEKRGAFSVAYGVDELDATALETGLTGLIEPTDRRFIATVGAVE